MYDVKDLIKNIKSICDIPVIVNGKVYSFNQEEIHLLYNYILSLQKLKNAYQKDNKILNDKILKLEKELKIYKRYKNIFNRLNELKESDK